jgi:ABC-2 type transport system ATP-binding protein
MLSPFYPRFNLEQFRHNLTELDVPYDAVLPALSYGQKKKALIAFALATNPRVLLMDEPTNGLDIPSKSQFRRLVASSLEPDRVFLISTHQVRDLDNLIDSVIILDESEILLCQPLHVVSERLHFANIADSEPQEQVLYAEPALRGQAVVMENLYREESKVDLERLFNAAMTNRSRIQQLFR